MPRIRYTENDVDLIARMMRAEAVAEGRKGMLLVGNVIVNRAVSGCLDFKNIRNIQDVIFQKQGGNYSFEAVQKGSLFYQRARPVERKLARMTLNGWRKNPADFSLWYFNLMDPCPQSWFGEPFAGRYKNHCFYMPGGGTCPGVYMT